MSEVNWYSFGVLSSQYVCFAAVEQHLRKFFETKKSEKPLYTHSSSEEPPNFYAAGTGKPSPDSDKDNKKGILPPVSMAVGSGCPQQQGSINQLCAMIKTLGHNGLIVFSRDKKIPLNLMHQTISGYFCLLAEVF